MAAPDWQVTQAGFDPQRQHHHETIFTIGNGYLATRGAFEEGYPQDRRATFIHGVFDAAPIVVTELANAPDWLALSVHVDGERFGLDRGTVETIERSVDLRAGVLARHVQWRSPQGRRLGLAFERFASLAQPHLLYLRVRIVPEAGAKLEVRAALNGNVDNDGLLHWRHVDQAQALVLSFDPASSVTITAGGQQVQAGGPFPAVVPLEIP